MGKQSTAKAGVDRATWLRARFDVPTILAQTRMEENALMRNAAIASRTRKRAAAIGSLMMPGAASAQGAPVTATVVLSNNEHADGIIQESENLFDTHFVDVLGGGSPPGGTHQHPHEHE